MLPPVQLVSRIQELRVVARSDQFLEFSGAQLFLREIPKIKLKSVPFHEAPRLAASRAAWLMKKPHLRAYAFRPLTGRPFSRRLAFRRRHRSTPQYRGTRASTSVVHRSIPPAIERAPSTPCERSHAAASMLRIPWWQKRITSSARSKQARFAGIS